MYVKEILLNSSDWPQCEDNAIQVWQENYQVLENKLFEVPFIYGT